MSRGAAGLDRVAANERLFLLGSGDPSDRLTALLACECTADDCDRHIALTQAEYDPVRVSAARYAIFPANAHVDPDADRLVEKQLRYWIVEREASIETMAFLDSRQRAIASDLAALARETRPTHDDLPT